MTGNGEGWLDQWQKPDPTILYRPEKDDLDFTRYRVQLVIREPGKRPALYGQLLQDAVHDRSRMTWESIPYGSQAPEGEDILRVELGLSEPESPDMTEGYLLETFPEMVRLTGFSHRGLLFAVGRLLRELELDQHESYTMPLQTVCALRTGLRILSAPEKPLRMHQIAYRPKTNSYDAFSEAMMRDEILHLAWFGTNAIELIPPGLDDAGQSPHFGTTWTDMLHSVSAWCDDLDLQVSIWYPLFLTDYASTEGIRRAEDSWRGVFSALARLDMLFVPGGDPGGRSPEEFLRLVARKAAFLRSGFFPRAGVWVSSQYGLGCSVDLGLTWDVGERAAGFFKALRNPGVQKFLTGVVYGPWTAVSLEEFRRQVPEDFPVRDYPDLCHTSTCGYPVDGIDPVYSVVSREPVTVRPAAFLRIYTDNAPHADAGPGCYSEGINDEVNKYIWSILAWGKDHTGPLAGASPRVVLDRGLQQWAGCAARCPRQAETIVRGLYALEETWTNPPESGAALRALRLFRTVEAAMTPRLMHQWRLNLLLIRAYADAFLALRKMNVDRISERSTPPGKKPLPDGGPALPPPLPDMDQLPCDLTGIYARIHSLAGQLFESAGYQSSVGYGGQHRQRGAWLDTLRDPLPGKARQAAAPDPEEKGQTLWYGNFGATADAVTTIAPQVDPRLTMAAVVPPYRRIPQGEDAGFYTRPLIEHIATDNDEVLDRLNRGSVPPAHRTWLTCFRHVCPRIRLRFSLEALGPALDPGRDLHLRITYVGKDLNRTGGDWQELGRRALPTRLLANDSEVHGFLNEPETTAPAEFILPAGWPRAADGYLTLIWEPERPEQVSFTAVLLPLAELWILVPPP